jgi:hypothetical protein
MYAFEIHPCCCERNIQTHPSTLFSVSATLAKDLKVLMKVTIHISGGVPKVIGISSF